MVELLVLLILAQDKSSIYGIKQKIDKNYFLFVKISFGSIHPTLKKLMINKYVAVKNKLSIGGQKTSEYSITDSGIEHLRELMLEDLPENPSTANQIMNIKLLSMSAFDAEIQKLVINSIIKYLNYQNLCAQDLLDNSLDFQYAFQVKLIKRYIHTISEKINWMKSFTTSSS